MQNAYERTTNTLVPTLHHSGVQFIHLDCDIYLYVYIRIQRLGCNTKHEYKPERVLHLPHDLMVNPLSSLHARYANLWKLM